MLRTRLLTATAALALFAAPSAFAQDATVPAPQDPVTSPAPTAPPATDPSMPMAPATTPAMPGPSTPAPATPPAAAAVASNTVVDVLRSNGQFTTLLTAIEAAQLTETLSSQPAISIFAPTDAAFAALPEADRTRLMDPANVNELRQLLLYHVVVADVNSSQIEGAQGGVATASNAQVQLDGTGDSLKVDAATIVQADIDASNGAIFAIDQVLNPATSQAAMGDEEAVPATTATEEAPAAEAAPAMDDTMTDDAVADDTTAPVAADPAVSPATADPVDPATTTPPVDGAEPTDGTGMTPTAEPQS